MKKNVGFFSLFFLVIIFIFDSVGIIKITVFAAIVHEIGHIAAYFFIYKKLPTVCFSVCGFCMKMPQCSKKEDLIITISGLAFNFFLSIICAVYLYTVKFTGFTLALLCTSTAIGVFNSLPFSFLDGGRIIKLIIPIKYLFIYEKIQNILCLVFAVILLFFVVSAGGIQKLSFLCFMVYFIFLSLKA